MVTAVMKKKFSKTRSAAQAKAAKMRECYLKSLDLFLNKSVKIKMYEGVVISGVLKAIDPYNQKVIIANAPLPIGGTLPAALLRTSDIISICLD